MSDTETKPTAENAQTKASEYPKITPKPKIPPVPHLRILAIVSVVFALTAGFLDSPILTVAFGLPAVLAGLVNLFAFGDHKQYRGWATLGTILGGLSLIYSVLLLNGVMTANWHLINH